MPYCYFDGALLEEENVSISIHNLGLQRGFGIFDFFRGRNGKPVFMEDHLKRFDRSQRFLNLSKMIPLDEIREAIDGLQQWNDYQESAFRLMLIADGNEGLPILEPLFYITNTDLSSHSLPESTVLISHEYLREFPEIKSINYLTSMVLHRQRKAADAIDVLYHLNGVISEASRSNVFIVKDGILKTPSDNILEGITRKQILKFAPDLLPTEIQNISLEEVIQADEVFITSTLKEVMPITEIDGTQIGRGKIGPWTEKIQERFSECLMG